MTIDELLSNIDRSLLISRLGIKTGAVTEAINRKILPASWYPVVRDICADNGIEAPEELFNFKSAEQSA